MSDSAPREIRERCEWAPSPYPRSYDTQCGALTSEFKGNKCPFCRGEVVYVEALKKSMI